MNSNIADYSQESGRYINTPGEKKEVHQKQRFQTVLPNARTLELLQALNAASAFIQKSVNSEEDIFNAFSEQVSRLGLRGGLAMLDESGSSVIIRAIGQPPAIMKLLVQLERKLKLKIMGYAIPVSRVTPYRQVIESHKPVYVEHSSAVITEFLPASAQPFLTLITDALGSSAAVYAPLIRDTGIIGILSIAGPGITPQDSLAIEAFANQIAIALKNQALYQAARKEIADRKDAELALRLALEQSLRSQETVLALTEIAQNIQRVHTVESLYQVLQEQFTRLDYHSTLFELTTDHRLRLVFTAYRADLVQKAESMARLSARGYEFEPASDSIYGKVLSTGETIHVSNPAESIADALPAKLRFLASTLRDLIGLQPSTIASLKVGEESYGILAITGPSITAADNPSITAFARQAAIALQNARLYEAAQKEIAERKQAEERGARQVERLKALHTIDTVINSSFDLHAILDVLMGELSAQLKVDAVSILLLNKNTMMLEHKASRGFRSSIIKQAKLAIGEAYAGQVIVERKIIHIPHLEKTNSRLANALSEAGDRYSIYFGVPLIIKGQAVGVLEIFHRTIFEADPEWLNFLETLAGQTAIAINNAQLFEDLQRSNFEMSLAYDATIEGWSRAMDLRDQETENHSLRVTNLTLKLARVLGFPEAELIHIRRGALLHDIGKLGIPDSILLKDSALTDDEWAQMKQHPTYAFNMLLPIIYLKPALDIPYCHHEKWDGTGYPRGLKGEKIPHAARIFAVVDVWDALTSDRPYRPAWTREKALGFIQEQSGKHFDPQVVEAFLAILKQDSQRSP